MTLVSDVACDVGTSRSVRQQLPSTALGIAFAQFKAGQMNQRGSS